MGFFSFQNLDSLLALISEIVEKHTDTDVLEGCSKTYEALCMDELVIHSRCAVARGTLVDKLVNKYKEALEEYNQLVTYILHFIMLFFTYFKSADALTEKA